TCSTSVRTCSVGILQISLSATGGGEGEGEVGDPRRLPASTSPSQRKRAGPLPLPPEGRRGAFRWTLQPPLTDLCFRVLQARHGQCACAFPPYTCTPFQTFSRRDRGLALDRHDT